MPPAAPPALIVTGTLAGGPRANQDHIVVTDHAVAVLDGATSWLPQDPSRDGGWYARGLGAALITLLSDDSRELAELVGESIAQMRDRYGLSPGDCPTSTVTIARWTPEAIDVYALGDSPAVVYAATGTTDLVHDDPLEHVGAAQREAYRRHLRSGAGYDGRLADLVADLQRAERDQRNTPGGCWIAESDPAAAEHGLTARYPTDAIAAVLILSDGAAAAVTDYGLHDWLTSERIISSGGPGSVALRDSRRGGGRSGRSAMATRETTRRQDRCLGPIQTAGHPPRTSTSAPTLAEIRKYPNLP